MPIMTQNRSLVFISLYYDKLLFEEEFPDLIISIIISSWFTSILCQVIPYSLCFFSNSLWFIDHHLKQKCPLSINTLFYQCKYWLKFNIFKKLKRLDTKDHQCTGMVKYLMQNRVGGTLPRVKMCLFQFVLQLEPNDVCKTAKGAKAKEHHLCQNHYH